MCRGRPKVYNPGAFKATCTFRSSFPSTRGFVTGLGVLKLLEALRQHLKNHASGRAVAILPGLLQRNVRNGLAHTPQTELTPFHPRSPYACAKVYAYWQTINYREAYGMFACNGILFNHESPRRDEAFVTRKITRTATRIKVGLAHELRLGNLDARRDWGFAGDYIEAMWRMLQQPAPDDYVIATGETHSVREFLDEVFGHLDLDWNQYVKIDPQFYRPTEVDALRGDAAKARRVLHWQPRVAFRELARIMTEADLKLAESECRMTNVK